MHLCVGGGRHRAQILFRVATVAQFARAGMPVAVCWPLATVIDSSILLHARCIYLCMYIHEAKLLWLRVCIVVQYLVDELPNAKTLNYLRVDELERLAVQ
jgi:hypothetical protein